MINVVFLLKLRQIGVVQMRTSFIACLLLIISGKLHAYSNPTIKVLLFKTSQTVKISSPSGLIPISHEIRFKNDRSLKIKAKGKSTLLLDNIVPLTKPLLLKSESKISVLKPNTRFSRRYQGLIEVRPFKKGVYVINHLPLETYLAGVLNAEISTKWAIEVVKVQAVISRTFALYQMENRKNRLWHVTSGLSDQVYLGADIADKRGQHAIQQTRGLVVTYQGKLAQTFYHSNCGGVTEDAGALWKYSYPYLKVRTVPYGKSDPRFSWEARMSQADLERVFRKLGFKGQNIKELTISEYSPSGRVAKIYLNGLPQNSYKGKDFRRAAGYRKIQSLLFKISGIPGGILFSGTGNGHGVGLSQWSAKEMAEKGYQYYDIIEYFYQGTQLKRYWR